MIMEALLESIKQMNRLMLPYLKPDTYEEFMATQHVDKKLNDMFQEMQNNALYKSQLDEAQSNENHGVRDLYDAWRVGAVAKPSFRSSIKAVVMLRMIFSF